MTISRIHTCVIAVLSMLAPTIAASQSATGTQGPGEAQIILKIPVNISGYSPDVTHVSISCAAQFTGDKNRQISSTGGSFTMTGGAFHDNPEFSLTLSLVAPKEEWSYSCQLVQLYNEKLKAWSSGTLDEVWAKPSSGSARLVSGKIIVQ